MIELIIKEYLEKHLNIPVFYEYPEEDRPSFIIIEKLGSGGNQSLKNSLFAFQSYGQSLYEAACLNEKTKEIIGDIDTLEGITAAKLNSDYKFMDLARKKYRYQAIYDIYHY